MKMTSIDIGDSATYDTNNLRSLLIDASQVLLRVPCKSIGNANSNLDVAHDWLMASFVSESIGPYCEEFRYEEHRHSHGLDHRFYFCPRDVESLVSKLYWLHPAFNDDMWWDDSAFEEVMEAVSEYSESLGQQELRFPDLADRYFANHIAGYYDLDEQTVAAIFREYPERRYGFWRSFASRSQGYDFYVSHWAWIVPLEVDIEALLSAYGGFSEGLPNLIAARYLSISTLPSIVFHEHAFVNYPFNRKSLARRCAEDIEGFLPKEEDLSDIALCGDHESQLLLSFEGELLVVRDDLAQYVFFGDQLSSFTDLGQDDYLSKLMQAVNVLQELIDGPMSIACPWEKLSDEQFEELCYDIICKCGLYDPQKTQKMGKSRSRDGGRDIEAYSRERLGTSVTKWLIQCKLIRDGSSLSGSKLDVADPVLQFGAQGYCVMTSALIDSTLHDKLSAVGQRLGITTSQWSRLELERFLARHPQIKGRYFPP